LYLKEEARVVVVVAGDLSLLLCFSSSQIWMSCMLYGRGFRYKNIGGTTCLVKEETSSSGFSRGKRWWYNSVLKASCVLIKLSRGITSIDFGLAPHICILWVVTIKGAEREVFRVTTAHYIVEGDSFL